MTINTGEPTHLDADSIKRPGAADLKAPITQAKVDEVKLVSDEFYKDADHRQAASASNPQITGSPYAPLETLIMDALRDYGETNPGSMYADVSTMFLGFANQIIEDLRAHPYFDLPDLDYYVALTETRTIPDTIVKAGLKHYYALQQVSVKAKIYEPAYYKTMNTVLYNRKYGNAPIEVQPRK